MALIFFVLCYLCDLWNILNMVNSRKEKACTLFSLTNSPYIISNLENIPNPQSQLHL
jgi:hypothetical protein